MFVALLALTFRAPALELGRVVTLSRLLPELRAPGDPELFLAPDLKNEAIYLRGTSTTDLPRLRALVARATSAVWTNTGTTLKLERPPALRKKLREAELATLTAEFRTALQTPDLPPETTSEDYTRLQQLEVEFNREPDGPKRDVAVRTYETALLRLEPNLRTQARLAAALKPDLLAALPPGDPVRYLGAGGFPRLPFNGARLLASYRTDYIAAREGGIYTDPARDAEMREPESAFATGIPGLVLSRDPFGGVVATLYAVAASGAAFTVASFSLVTRFDSPDTPPWPGETPANATRPLPGFRRPDPNATTALLRRGDEPLILFAPTLDAFFGALRGETGEEAPVVLDLPDEAVNLADGRSSTVADLARALRRCLRAERDGPALVGTPRLPLEASSLRFPRAELRRWFALVSRLDATLDECAALAARIGDAPAFTGIEDALRIAADVPIHGQHPWGSGLQSRYELRLWGALPRSFRAALDSGRTLALAELPSETRRIALDAILVLDSGSAETPVFIRDDGRAPSIGLAWGRKVRPSALEVDGPKRGTVWGTEALGMILSQQSRGELLDPSLGYPDVRTARFRPTMVTDRTLLFTWEPRSVPIARVRFFETFLLESPAVGWESFPPELLTPLRKGFEEEHKSHGGG